MAYGLITGALVLRAHKLAIIPAELILAEFIERKHEI